MQPQTSDNSGFNKLKSIFFLGLSCNYTTLSACIILWVLLQHNNWVLDWWEASITVFSLMPFFMGDAVNSYVLGRIRLEHLNDWDDLDIVQKEKERIADFYKLYRALSLISSCSLAATALYKRTALAVPSWLIAIAALTSLLNFLRCIMTITKGVAPILPEYGKSGMVHRFLFLSVASLLGYLIFREQGHKISLPFIFTSGAAYFMFCGLMHPLPSKGSLLSSFIRDSMVRQAATNYNEALADYSKRPEDIEDAAIVDIGKEAPVTLDNSANNTEHEETLGTINE